MVHHAMGDFATVAGIGGHLKAVVTMEELERKARSRTDTEVAAEMRKTREKLFGVLPKADGVSGNHPCAERDRPGKAEVKVNTFP